MSESVSEYFASKPRSAADQRRYFQNDFILSTAIAINRAIEEEGVSQKDLAARLGRSEGYVSQVLSGGTNLTLRTLADFAYGLGFVVDVVLRKSASHALAEPKQLWTPTKIARPKESEAADSQYALAA